MMFLQYDENESTEVMTRFLYFFKDSKPTKVRFQAAAKERTTQVFILLDVPFECEALKELQLGQLEVEYPLGNLKQ